MQDAEAHTWRRRRDRDSGLHRVESVHVDNCRALAHNGRCHSVGLDQTLVGQPGPGVRNETESTKDNFQGTKDDLQRNCNAIATKTSAKNAIATNSNGNCNCNEVECQEKRSRKSSCNLQRGDLEREMRITSPATGGS